MTYLSKLLLRQTYPKVTADDLVITMPEEEAKFLKQTYAQASAILEYGSGGSTIVAAQLGKSVTAVESDATWASDMSRLIAHQGYSNHAKIVYQDIGPTKEWGKPKDATSHARYHNYPLAVWDDASFNEPDIVLVDGRFRVACFCAAVLRCTQPIRIMIDDYTNRPAYHVVEHLIEPSQIVGRMAVFDIVPNINVKVDLTWIMGSFVDPA